MVNSDSKSNAWHQQISRAVRADQHKFVLKLLRNNDSKETLAEIIILALNFNAERVFFILLKQINSSNQLFNNISPESAFSLIANNRSNGDPLILVTAITALKNHGMKQCAMACQNARDAHIVRLIFRVKPSKLLVLVSGNDAREYCWAQLAAPI